MVLLPSWLRILSPSRDSCTVTRSETPSLLTMFTLNRSVEEKLEDMVGVGAVGEEVAQGNSFCRSVAKPALCCV